LPVIGIAVFPHLIAQRAYDLFQTAADSGVGEPQFFLNTVELTLAAEKNLHEVELFRGELIEPAHRKTALQRRAAVAANQASYQQLVVADRAFRGYRIHGVLLNIIE